MNEDMSGNVQQLQAEIRRLREALEKYKGVTDSILALLLSTVMDLRLEVHF